MDKPKFNLMDGLIILLIILVAAAGIYFLKGSGTPSSTEVQNTNAIFDIQLTRAEKSLYDKFSAAMENGESVWIGVKERFEGKIEEIALSPSSKITTDLHHGKSVLAEDPGLYDITITVKAAALETPSAISASGTEIRVGEETAIRGKGFAGYGFIVGLKTVTE